DGRQQQGDQHGDDRDHDKQFNQRERTTRFSGHISFAPHALADTHGPWAQRECRSALVSWMNRTASPRRSGSGRLTRPRGESESRFKNFSHRLADSASRASNLHRARDRSGKKSTKWGDWVGHGPPTRRPGGHADLGVTNLGGGEVVNSG